MRLNSFVFVISGHYQFYFSTPIRLEHQKMHEQHKGHDAMHAEMIIILLVTLIVAQVVLVEWKKRHYKSFSVSLLCVNQMKYNLTSSEKKRNVFESNG